MSLGQQWPDLMANMVFASCLLVIGAAFWGLASLRWSRREGRTSPELRSRHIRLPLFIAGMTLSYLIVLQTPWWSYPIIGVVWGATYPVRLAVSLYQLYGTFDREPFRDKLTWELTGILTVAHGLLWPLSVPASFVTANEFGVFLSDEDTTS